MLILKKTVPLEFMANISNGVVVRLLDGVPEIIPVLLMFNPEGNGVVLPHWVVLFPVKSGEIEIGEPTVKL